MKLSRMSDLDIEMQEMLERGVSIDDVASHFNVPIEWVWQSYANLLQASAELWFDDSYEV